MQAKCRGSCDLGNIEGKTWHALMAMVETLKTTRERRPSLLLRPRLVKHPGQHCGITRDVGSRGVGLVVRKGVFGPTGDFRGGCDNS